MSILQILCFKIVLVFSFQLAWCKQFSSAKFDYFVFAQQWPVAVCAQAFSQHEHGCFIPPTIKPWSIHGLWPSLRNQKDAPIYCNSSSKLDVKQIEPLMSQLLVKWPNLFQDQGKYEFWEHEWSKHGTCATADTATDGQYRYFSKTLELAEKYDISKLLKFKGVLPNNQTAYKPQDLFMAITDQLHTNVSILCQKDKITGRYFFLQIEICLDKNFNPIDCDENELQQTPASSVLKFYPKNFVKGSTETNCPKTAYYPKLPK